MLRKTIIALTAFATLGGAARRLGARLSLPPPRLRLGLLRRSVLRVCAVQLLLGQEVHPLRRQVRQGVQRLLIDAPWRASRRLRARTRPEPPWMTVLWAPEPVTGSWLKPARSAEPDRRLRP